MRDLSRLLIFISTLALVGPALAAGGPVEDPVAYCRSAGTIDAPGADYAGPAVPAWMVAKAYPPAALAAQKQAGMDPAKTIVWRCAGGNVLMCVQGNAPQCGKANQSEMPTEAMKTFCAETPSAEVIPLYVIGHENPMVFEWSCDGTTPKRGRAVFQVDAQGFPTELWEKVSP